MEYLLLAVVSFGASLLTFFSGFGLGTILTPFFIIWLPLDKAVAVTAIVHFANNLFKLGLVGKSADLKVLWRFGAPAIMASFFGALILLRSSSFAPIYEYTVGSKIYSIYSIKLLVAALMIFFTLFEIVPKLSKLNFDSKYLSIGGALSGFFGGLSGHQGALRSAFLIRANLSKEAFVGTGAMIASMIDLTRLTTYATHFSAHDLALEWRRLLVATLFAFIGAYFGKKLLKKSTMKGIQMSVSVALLIMAILLGLGIV